MRHRQHNASETNRLTAWLATENLYAAERGERFMVTGSRTWADRQLVTHVLGLLPPITMLNGKAAGLDGLAANLWAAWHGAELVDAHPVTSELWSAFGGRAGRLRNERMLGLWPRFVVAFRRDGSSPGTDHATGVAEERGIPVFRFRQELGACAPPT